MSPPLRRAAALPRAALVLGLLALSCLLAPSRAQAQEPVYVAVLIGSNAYQGDSKLDGLSFADDDVLRVYQTLGPLLHPDRVRLILSPDPMVEGSLARVGVKPAGPATRAEVLQGFSWMEGEIKAIRRRFGAQVEINALVFVSAHGDALGVHLEDGVLSGSALQDALGTLSADNTVLIADACYASSWLVMKGEGEDPVPPPFPIEDVARAVKDLERLGVVAAQSGTREERGLIRGGMLTHMVASGLIGAADLDQDGRILFQEMDAYLSLYGDASDTLKRIQVLAPRKAPSLPPVLVDLAHMGASGLDFPGERGRDSERFWIFDEGGRLVAEFAKEGGDARRIWLPPGTYRVQRFSPASSWFGDEGILPVAGGFTRVTPTLLGEAWVWAGGKGEGEAPPGARHLTPEEVAYRSLSPVKAPISWRSLPGRDTVHVRLGVSNLAPKALSAERPEDSLTQERPFGEVGIAWDRRLARVGGIYVTGGAQGVAALSPGNDVGGVEAEVGALGLGARLGVEAQARNLTLKGGGAALGLSARALGEGEALEAYRLPLVPQVRLEVGAGRPSPRGWGQIEAGALVIWSAEAHQRGEDVVPALSRGVGIFAGVGF